MTQVVDPDTHSEVLDADSIRADFARCMVADRHPLARMLKPVRGQVDLAKANTRFAASRRRFDARASAVPVLSFDDSLPISARREALAEVIADNQVVIVCGETGSGKTTQLPKILLQLGRGVAGMIGHTQPRRIAARTVASRIAEEVGTKVGELVGYQVRFVDDVGPRTLVKLMTDGVLLAELTRDRFLSAYDTIIVDEAHERSLNIDFILGYLRQLLPQRPDLKVIVTSATIDPQRFAEHFSDAPVVEVSGRGYPVEVRYRPLAPDGEQDLNDGIANAVREALRHGPGDMLVFLPGEREIREAAQHLRQMGLADTEVLPFYARMGLAQQARIFARGAGRRIVLATNVAETSVTVPGISFVIDTGVARISRYSYRSKVQGLAVEPISQASAEQRKGRCGRISPGVCMRLYAQDDFEGRDAFTDAEIVRTNLAAVILQMKALRLGEIERFPFIDKPDPRFVKDGYRLLRELGALQPNDGLTRIGQQLARLPLDPRLGRMLIAAAEHGAVTETLTIASALSVVDPRERPMDQRQTADQAHREFLDKGSDFVTLLNIWNGYQTTSREGTRGQLRAWCKSHFLSYMRMREWADVRRQLKSMAAELGIDAGTEAASYESLHRTLLFGLLSQVGQRHEESGFKGTRGSRFHLFPGSGVRPPGPKWLVAANLVQTRRLYAHVVAGIQPQWIETVAGELVSKRYHEPRWDPRRGEVIATEQVTFLGLVLTANRRVAYARIDPIGAQSIFLQEALVRGRTHERPDFLRDNIALIEDVRELERRLRRADLVVDEDWQIGYYQDRLPGDVVSMRALGGWLKRASGAERAALVMEREQVLVQPEAEDQAAAFPHYLEFGEHRLPLVYGFEPGADADGVCVRVPVAILNQLNEHRGEWLVPGLLREKTIALLRALPKRFRRHLVPLPDFAKACVEALVPSNVALVVALTEALERMTGVSVPADAWQPQMLALHLLMRYEIIDDDGDMLGSGRDLGALKVAHGATSADAFGALVRGGGQIDKRSRWDFGELPARADFATGGIEISGFPALVDQRDSVGVRVLQDAHAAADSHRAGVRRLFKLAGGRALNSMPKKISGLQSSALVYATCAQAQTEIYAPSAAADGPLAELSLELLDSVIDQSLGSTSAIRDAEQFGVAAALANTRVGGELERSAALVQQCLEQFLNYQRVRDKVDGPGRVDALRDTDAQLARLLFRGFVRTTQAKWLVHLPRFVSAAIVRLQHLDRDARVDTARLAEILAVEKPVWQRIHGAGIHWQRDSALVHARWMLEELRVSTFAQQLRTSTPVSIKRIQKLLHEMSERDRLGDAQ